MIASYTSILSDIASTVLLIFVFVFGATYVWLFAGRRRK